MMKNANYEGRIDPHDTIWEKSPWRQLLIERYNLSAYFCTNRFVLDTCCGTGWGTVRYIAPIAKHVVGFDLSTPYTSEPYDKTKCSFCLMDARNIEFRGDSFDVVLALDSIEHISFNDGLKYVAGIKSVLKDKGILFGTTPLVEKPYLIPIFLGWNKYHLHMYTENILRQVLLNHFEYVNISSIYNEVCPYFTFACSDEGEQLHAVDLRISEFIANNRQRFSSGKKTAYRLWAMHLLKNGLIFQSLTYLLSSLKRHL
jgi:ubiquinone/menaquinone biosynthesis C-methylase UbiE